MPWSLAGQFKTVSANAPDAARVSGMRWLRTFHHPANDAAILMNRRLGFIDDTDELAK